MSTLGQKQAIHAANLLSNRCHVAFSSKRSIGQASIERGHDNHGFSIVEYQRFLADANEEHVGSICARWRAR
jgi:hypothetical protein